MIKWVYGTNQKTICKNRRSYACREENSYHIELLVPFCLTVHHRKRLQMGHCRKSMGTGHSFLMDRAYEDDKTRVLAA